MEAYVVALLNGAWQGAALCSIAWFCSLFLRKQNATTLFAFWLSIWTICIALPFLDYTFSAAPFSAPAIASRVFDRSRDSRYQTAATTTARTAPPSTNESLGVTSVWASRLAGLEEARSLVPVLLRLSAPAVLAVLCLIGAFRLALVIRDLVNMLAARKRVSHFEAPTTVPASLRPVTFATSSEFSSPCLLGLRPAIIVLPDSLLGRQPDQIRSVVLHELEHARRFDDFQNVLMRAVGAIAFFLPGVILAERKLQLFRERICDDAAIAGGFKPMSYAGALAVIARDVPFRRSPAPGLLFERKSLLQRIAALVDKRANHSLTINRGFYLAGVLPVALAALLIFRVQLPAMASDAQNITSSDAHSFTGRFTVSSCPRRDDAAQLQLDYFARTSDGSDSINDSHCVPYTEFRGLRPDDLTSDAVARRTFDIVRDAGTLRAIGKIGGGSGAGTWTFLPSSTLADQLHKRGLETPSAMGQLEWTLSDFRLATIDVLERSGFDRPTLRNIQLLIDIGNTAPLIAAAAKTAAPKTISDLIRAAEVGVTPQQISAFDALGYHLSLRDLVRCAEVGVTPAWVQTQLRSGITRPTVDDLIRARTE
jgi:beta-lactamase regulating signal transducer with metallopeptidase domain